MDVLTGEGDLALAAVAVLAVPLWALPADQRATVEGHVTLTLQNTKGGKVRTITLRQQAIDILLHIPRSNRSPYVFWNKTDDGYYVSVRPGCSDTP